MKRVVVGVLLSLVCAVAQPMFAQDPLEGVIQEEENLYRKVLSNGLAVIVVEDASLPPALRDTMRAAGQIVPYEPEPGAGASTDHAPPDQETQRNRQWRYTQGVSLGEFRVLMQLD